MIWKLATPDRSRADTEPERARSWTRELTNQLPGLLALAVLAIGLGWLGMKAYHARQQSAAVESLGAKGVKYDFGLTYDADSVPHYSAAAKPPGAAIIRWLFGDYVFANIVSISLSKDTCEHLNPARLEELAALDTLENLRLDDQPIGDADLDPLIYLRNLKVLVLSGTKISDETLRKLSGMRQLEELDVSQTKISGVGLVHLQKCSRLKTLWVCDVAFTPEGARAIGSLVMLETLHAAMYHPNQTGIVGDGVLEGCAKLKHLDFISVDGRPVTDAGLRHLRAASQLKGLDLDDTQITNEGLAFIATLPQLTLLSLRWNKVTDAGMAHVRQMVALKTLHLERNPISDDGLRQLRGHKQLTELSLGETLITDQCLPVLKELPSLEWCVTQDTAVTAEGRRQIATELPQLELF